MKLYLNMNIYNRIFDDKNQIRIRFETMAIDVRYIRNFEEGHGEDYLKVQDNIYKGMSLFEVFDKASSNWHKVEQK